MWCTASSQLAAYGPTPNNSLHLHAISRLTVDVDEFVVFRDIRDTSDTSDVCQGLLTVPETFETLSGFTVDGVVSRKPVSMVSAETQEMPKSTN